MIRIRCNTILSSIFKSQSIQTYRHYRCEPAAGVKPFHSCFCVSGPRWLLMHVLSGVFLYFPICLHDFLNGLHAAERIKCLENLKMCVQGVLRPGHRSTTCTHGGHMILLSTSAGRSHHTHTCMWSCRRHTHLPIQLIKQCVLRRLIND